MSNLAKKLPQLQQYRPYKYNEVRRRFRMSTDNKKREIASIEEEKYHQVLKIRESSNVATPREHTTIVTPRDYSTLNTSREKSNLVSSRNLGVSRENLGASQESLNREDTVLSRNPLYASTESLRTDIKTRQTSLENFKKKEENGRNLYTFTLQKVDRSYSEPMIFPPLTTEKHKSKTSQGKNVHENRRNDNDTPHVNRLLHKDNTMVTSKDHRKPPTGIKFPVVSRNDLYKHLGISHEGRKRKKLEPGEKISKEDYNSRYRPKIFPESGGSRHVAVSSNPYGRGPEPIAKNKVEMYKQWHEEQNKHKIKKGIIAETTRDAVKLASVYREKLNAADARNKQNSKAGNRKDATFPKIGLRNTIQTDKVTRSNAQSRAETNHLQATKLNPGPKVNNNPRPDSPPATIPEELFNRVYSSNTWRTWRDIHESYSYTNVHEYIEDNELMDEEKEEWIKDWIDDVDRKYFNPSPADSDAEEEEGTENTSQSQQSEQEKSATTAEESNIIVEKAEAITKL